MEKSKIEWTDSTYNPVTGCYNNCPYCYAGRIANRLKGCDNCPKWNLPFACQDYRAVPPPPGYQQGREKEVRCLPLRVYSDTPRIPA